MIQLAALLFTAAIAYAEESHLCSNDAAQICAAYKAKDEPSAQTMRQTLLGDSAMNKLKEISKGRDNGELDKYAALIGDMNSAIMAEAAKQGISPAQLQAHFNKMRDQLVQRLKASAQFKNSPRAVARMSETSLYDAGRLAEASSEERSEFFDQCGIDGLQPGASYDGNQNQVILCPGFVLQSLRGGGLSSMDMILSHELGHSIDAFSEPPATVVPPLRGNFDCVKKYYSEEFYTLTKAREGLQKKALPFVESCLQKMQRERPGADDDLLAVKMRIDAFKTMLQRADYAGQELQDMGLKDDGLSSHIHELGADCFAHIAMSEDPKILGAQLTGICGPLLSAHKDPVEKLCGPGALPAGWGNGQHPSDSYRVLAALKNPRLRRALGCTTPVPANKPWCGLESEAGAGAGDAKDTGEPAIKR